MTAFNLRQASPSFGTELLSRPARVTKTRPEVSSWSRVLTGGVAALAAPIREHLRRRRVMAELSRLTDRELADIGLSRSEIGLIYSAEFAARRNARPHC
ncbi:MAG: DUF1127 domain-containing protein [Acetobacteraceae bacterium]